MQDGSCDWVASVRLDVTFPRKRRLRDLGGFELSWEKGYTHGFLQRTMDLSWSYWVFKLRVVEWGWATRGGSRKS